MAVAILRLEGLWWMTRPVSVTTAFIAIPGWLAAESPPSNLRLAAMVGAVMAGRMFANVVNDLFDREKDRVTAPWLPLPSGIVSVNQAVVLALALALCTFVLLRAAAPGWHGFLLGATGIVLGGAIYGTYSMVKPYAIAALVVTGIVYVFPPVVAWLVAGGGWSQEIAVVLVYAGWRGLAANVFSTLRDVDRDAEVGNRSIAVRLGPGTTLALGVALELAATCCILGIAAERQRLLLGVLVVGTSALTFVVAYLRSAEKIRRATNRIQRTVLMRPVNIARNYVGIILVQSISIGIAAAAVTVVVRKACIGPYARRIPGGELRRALLELEGSDAANRAAAESRPLVKR